MTLPTSGPLYMSNIRAEFGGSLPAYIRSYYRGGALVPNTARNAGVPTSGQIMLSHFLGAGAPFLIDPINITESSSAANPAAPNDVTITLYLRIKRNGFWGVYLERTGFSLVTYSSGRWIDEAGDHATVGDGFEVRYVLVSGALNVNEASSFVPINTDIDAVISVTIPYPQSGSSFDRSATFTVQLRKVGGGIVQKNISLYIVG